MDTYYSECKPLKIIIHLIKVVPVLENFSEDPF
jgi:hypothetical protein